MLRISALAILVLAFSNADAQSGRPLSLSDLFRFRKMSLETAGAELRARGWRQSANGAYYIPSPGSDSYSKAAQRVSFYYVGKKHILSVEYYSRNTMEFNSSFRDSLEAYGYVPDIDYAMNQHEAMVTKRRFKPVENDNGRRILVKFRDKLFLGKTATMEIFEVQ